MTAYSEAQIEHRQLAAFYEKLAAFVRTHTIDDIDKMVMDGAFAAEWPEIDANAPPTGLPKWNELKPATPSRVPWLGHAEKTPDEVERVTQGRNLAALEKLRIHLRHLAEIPEALARELAKVLDLTVADGRRVAAQAPVAAVGARAGFQIPLGTYFRDVLHLSDEIVQQWAEATLSFQQRGEHVRLVLNSCAQGWALAVSLGGHSAKVLDSNNRDGGLIDCATADIDRHQMAIVPFRPRP
jgi:hypothetical protein